jgi:methionyl-tRNA formyltransferase
MGSAAFSLPTLTALRDAGHTIAAVYTQPPRPVGRGHKVRRSALSTYAADVCGLTVRTPASLKLEAEQQAFRDLDLDAAVVAAYGLILPPAILSAPRLGCLNVHASLLPRWRGAAPVERAILAGDTETGVTIMCMDAGLDTGPTLIHERVTIPSGITAEQLRDALSRVGATLIVQALDRLAMGRLRPVPQPAEGVTYARKLEREEGRLNWQEPASMLERRVRALNPSPGVWFEHAGTRIKVHDARVCELSAGIAAAPGTVIDDALTIACGEGCLQPLCLQRAGREPLPFDAFLRGYPLPAGTRLALAAAAPDAHDTPPRSD